MWIMTEKRDHGYKQLKLVSFGGCLGSVLEMGYKLAHLERVRIEPFLLRNKRSQLKWFRHLIRMLASLWRFFRHIQLGEAP